MGSRLPGTSRLRFGDRHEMPVALEINFDAGGPVGAIHQSPVRRTSMLSIECDRRQTLAVVGFPCVELAVAVGVLFRRREFALLIALDSRDLAVTLRGDLDADDGAGRV